jgi:uncharacterized protein YecE (DUF72 family)
MQFLVGTSGYSYKEWKGSFYPAKLPQKEMLGFYAQHFATVEINSSFRRLPNESDIESWSNQVPKTFRFALKAPQSITHFKRLKDVDEPTTALLDMVSLLGPRRGPVLFQLPPNFKKDLLRLQPFLKTLGKKTLAAFEFRHPSWFDDEVFACLRKHRCALCVADAEELPPAKVISTARWGYVRLRQKRYTRKSLADWIQKIHDQSWDKAYVFFKHEDTGTGPRFAARFLELAQSQA